MFKTIGDYLVPLLRLLDEMPSKRGDASSVIKGFGWRYKQEIPEAHRRTKRTRVDQLYGAPIWEQMVRYARNRAVRFDLMDSPAKGVSQLTEQGRRWLAENPEAARLDRRKRKRTEQRGRVEQHASKNQHHHSGRERYREFFQEIQARLPELLPNEIEEEPHRFQSRANLWQVIFEAFGGCHYQITLRRDYYEIALHFESSHLASHERLRAFQPHIEELTSELGEPVQAGTMGPRGGWARVWLEREPEPLNESLASACAAQLAQFITATFPILQGTLRARNLRRSDRDNGHATEHTNPAYPILDREIELIRAYLAGRNDQNPSEEKKCDWVNFCYTFELYAEGRDLFKLVAADGVNPWYWERTRKLAKICELRSKNPS